MAALSDLALTDTFLDVLRRDSMLPAVQSSLTDQELLDIAYEKLVRRMAPVMVRARPGFFREAHDITLVAGQATYDIPEYAMWGKLYLAHMLDSNGEIGRLSRREQTEDYWFNETTDGHPVAIRLNNNQIEVNPAPSAADIAQWPTLRTYIHRRPGRLVRATIDDSGQNLGRCAKVASVASGVITFTADPPSAVFGATTVHDFYSATSPYRRVKTGAVASALSGSDQTFPVADAALVSAGDWVCLEDETCLLPIPVELSGNLKDLVIAQIAMSQGDREAMKSAEEQFAADMATNYPIAADPMDGNPQVITLHHSPFLRGLRARRSLTRP